MGFASLLTVSVDGVIKIYSYTRTPGTIIIAVLALSYLIIIGVALFHPDPKRRTDARALLMHHRFTRK